MPAGTDSLILTSSQQYSENKQTRIQFAEIMRAREQSTMIKELVDKATVQPGHYTIRYPLIGRLTAGPVEEGREIDTPVAMPTWSREVETVEWGTLSFRSDRVQRQTATHNITTEINTRQGEAMARQEEDEILDLFDDPSTIIDNSGNAYASNGNVALNAGSAGTRPKGINPNTFAMAKQEIMRERDTNLGAPPAGSNPFAVIAPSAVFQLTQNILSSLAADTTSGVGGPSQGGGGAMFNPGEVAIPSGLSEEIMRSYTVGRIGGVDVYQSHNLKVLDNTDGTAIATFNPRTGEKLGTADASETETTVSDGNSTSQGAVLINKSILLVREKEFNVDSEYMPRMRGEWYVATQEFKPYLMYDAWTIGLNAKSPVLSYTMPTNPVGFE